MKKGLDIGLGDLKDTVIDFIDKTIDVIKDIATGINKGIVVFIFCLLFVFVIMGFIIKRVNS